MPEIVDESGDILPAATNLFGKYELGRLLGYGGFAKVYHARDVRTGQSVAIKAINKQRLVKGGLTGHVKREVSIMRRLRHHHIVRLMEVLATKTKIYFVLEFAKGGELFTKVAKGRFSEDLCRRYFQQLIAAVGYCHSHGVFHRDLKLENLLLDENWDLKVTDFGLSAVRDQIQPDGDGLLHTLCGTPAYVAPEILAKKGYDGARVDLWSCGVILFVLNAGYLPFNDPNLMIMYKKIYNGDYRCPKWTSPDLKRLISRLLDTNPQTRISIAEMLDDPWFRKGYKEIKFKFHSDDFEIKEENRADADMFLNAFDIISYSPGIDLSSLFNRQEPKLTSRRFVSALPPPAIIAEIDSAARAEGLNVTSKKEFWVKLEEQNGNFVAAIEIRRLTESLAVVEVKRRDSAADAAGPSRDVWREKLSPILTRLVYSPQGEPVAGL